MKYSKMDSMAMKRTNNNLNAASSMEMNQRTHYKPDSVGIFLKNNFSIRRLSFLRDGLKMQNLDIYLNISSKFWFRPIFKLSWHCTICRMCQINESQAPENCCIKRKKYRYVTTQNTKQSRPKVSYRFL